MKRRKVLIGDWRMEGRGWWINERLSVGVVQSLKTRKWHSVVDYNDDARNTEPFDTMREAMIDAERRYKVEMKKGMR